MSCEHLSIDELLCHFEEQDDPRSEIDRKHSVVRVVLIAVMGVLAQATGPTGTATWAKFHEDLLTSLLPLPHGIPGKDVLRRVLCALRSEAFQQSSASWIAAFRANTALVTEIDQSTLAVDGKTLRRSHDNKKGLGPLHSLSVWASGYGIALAQVPADETSNEIRAIPAVLQLR